MDLYSHNQAVSAAHTDELNNRGCVVVLTLGQNARGSVFVSWDKTRMDADKLAHLLVETAIQLKGGKETDKHIVLKPV